MEKIHCWIDIKAATAIVILAEAKKSERVNLHRVTEELKKLAKAGFKFWNRYDLYGNLILEPKDSPDLPFWDSVYGWAIELISYNCADFNNELILRVNAQERLKGYVNWRLWTYSDDSRSRIIIRDLMKIYGEAFRLDR